jgi:hypothetical protein
MQYSSKPILAGRGKPARPAEIADYGPKLIHPGTPRKRVYRAFLEAVFSPKPATSLKQSLHHPLLTAGHAGSVICNSSLEPPLYRHGWDLERTAEAIALYHRTPADDTFEVGFYVFDLVSEEPFSRRWQYTDLVEQIACEHVRPVPSVCAPTVAVADALHDLNLKNRFRGNDLHCWQFWKQSSPGTVLCRFDRHGESVPRGFIFTPGILGKKQKNQVTTCLPVFSEDLTQKFCTFQRNA